MAGTPWTSLGGNFGAGQAQSISLQPGFDYYISSDGSGAAHSFTLAARGAGGTITRFVPTGGSVVVRGDGISSVSIDSADAHAFWESGPIDSFRLGNGSTTAVGAVLTAPAGAQIITTANLLQINGTLRLGTTVGNQWVGSTGALALKGPMNIYNAISTAGNGLPGIYAVTSQKAETTTADANVMTYTPPAASGLYRLILQADVTTATAGVVSFTISYHDSEGATVTSALVSIFQLGAAAPALAFTTSSASRYWAQPVIAIDASASNIVVGWVGGGVISAKVSTSIEQLI